MQRFVTCPRSAHLAQIEFTESAEDGRVLGVIRCTAFQPEEAVTCDMLCTKLLNQRHERRHPELEPPARETID